MLEGKEGVSHTGLAGIEDPGEDHDFAFVPSHLLQRPPNTFQEKSLRYFEALIRTFGSDQEGFLPSGTGRRIFLCRARLGELSSLLTHLGAVGDPDAWVPFDGPVAPSRLCSLIGPCVLSGWS